MTRHAPAPTDDEVQTPAKISELHVLGRPATDRDMKPVTGKQAWTKWTPLEAAYHGGKLGEKDSSDARSRLNAGLTYSAIWDAAQSAGRDSTQALNISRGTGGGGFSQAQSDSIKALVTIDSHLGQRDRIIIRMTCGEGHFPSEAVAMVSPDYAKATTARFKEALDALADVLETVRRHPGRVSLRVSP
jgi:hypothetical protein